MNLANILEQYDKVWNSVEASIFQNSAIHVDALIRGIVNNYRSGHYSRLETISSLEMMDSMIEELMYSSDYFDVVNEVMPHHQANIMHDWVEIDDKIKTLLRTIRG